MKKKSNVQKVRDKITNRKRVRLTEQVSKAVYQLRQQGVKINTIKKMVKGELVTYYCNGTALGS